ncbi:hypothetical protein PR048_011455 [Dryococelus australis]|uniref:Integrase catalytic domain-containing protein n=1 Tax=Dryococelus australis TaxID=614101 RepID=A0ABQ9HLM7_9NEOP|nr:hypothetical protein PR048_011455 [Dryococelus australis]
MYTIVTCNRRATQGKSRATLRLDLDIVRPMPKTASGNHYILTVIDHFSRYLVMQPLPDEAAETVAHTFVFDWILKFGVSDPTIIDQGTNFVCVSFESKKVGNSRTSTRKWKTEHMHRTIAKMIYQDMMVGIHTRTNTQLSHYEIVHGTKMSSPYEHLTERLAVGNSHVVEIARKLHDMWNSLKQCNSSTFLEQNVQCNNKAVDRQNKVGDLQSSVKVESSQEVPASLKGTISSHRVVISITLPTSATNDQYRLCGRPHKLHPALPPVKKKPRSSATLLPDPASAHTRGKVTKVSPPISITIVCIIVWHKFVLCVLASEIRVKPSNLNIVFEFQSDVIVSDSENIVVVNFNISASSEG